MKFTRAQLKAAGVDVPAEKRAVGKRAKLPVQLRGEQCKMIWLVLPYPPSVNTAWRRKGSQYYVSAAGKAFRKYVAEEVVARDFGHVTGRITVRIWLHAADKRVRDIDNVLKVLLDALQAAGLFEDDSQIDRLEVSRQGAEPGGKCSVQIEGEYISL